MIALTFDDGPGPMTQEILDSLREYGVQATFFIVGRNLVENPWTDVRGIGRSIVKRALMDGHIVGNHTYTHSRQIQSEVEFRSEVEKTDSLIRELTVETGRTPTIPPMRLPFGLRAEDPRLRFIAALGRPHVHWSKDFNDWHEGPIDRLYPEIISYVETRMQKGLSSVLNLHDGGIGGESGYERPATSDAVLRLLAESTKRGWQFFRSPLATC